MGNQLNGQNEKDCETAMEKHAAYATNVYQSRTFENATELIFHEAVNVNIDGCTFSDGVKLVFHEGATVNCKKTAFHGPVKMECFGKIDLNVEKCKFFGIKDIIFHEDSCLKLNRNQYQENILLKGHGKIDSKFNGCAFRKGKRVIYYSDTTFLTVDASINLQEEIPLIIVTILLLIALISLGFYIANFLL